MPCRLSASPAEQLNETESGSEIVSSPAASIFVMRDNPRQFFVRQPLPSTSSAPTASPAPSKQPEEPSPEDQPQSSSRTKSGGWWHDLMQIRPLSPWQDSCLIQLTQQGSHIHERVCTSRLCCEWRMGRLNIAASPADAGPRASGDAPSKGSKEPAANGDAGREASKPQKPSTPSNGRLTDDQVSAVIPLACAHE